MKKSILNICIIFMISLLSIFTPEMKSQNPEWMYFHDILDPDEITAIDNSIYLTEDYNRVIRINLENLEIDTIAHISAVSGIVHDKEKNIWMSTRFNGIYKYSNGNLENFTSSNSGLPDSRVYDLAVDNNNNIWCATRQGLAKYDGTDWEVYHFEHLETNGYIYRLAIDKDGSIWVINHYSPYIIAKFNNGEFTPYNGENTGITSINWSWDIDIDSKGNKWFVAGIRQSDSLGGLIIYDGDVWSIYDKHNSEISDHQFVALAIDSNDIIWTGSYYSGLYRFDGENWTNLNSSNSGLTANDVRSISVDKYNNKWIININEAAGNEYVLEVYNEGGVLLPSNVEEVLRKKSEISPRIYPNPASEIITVSDIVMRQRKFTITNILGQVMLGGEFYQEINISTLPKGYYLLHYEQFHLNFFKI
ncbi:MAG: T9SS type A sorting domain-containing protein [Candidatus Kapabacteria bacterium]|nr:T9SS type A sorting domain-containing protein [Candidatus Kapabacteria bacterium]